MLHMDKHDGRLCVYGAASVGSYACTQLSGPAKKSSADSGSAESTSREMVET